MSNSNNWILRLDPKTTFGLLDFETEKAFKILKVGLGSKKPSPQRLRKLLHKAIGFLAPLKAKVVSFETNGLKGFLPDFLALSLLEANYTYDRFKAAKNGLCDLSSILKSAQDQQFLSVLSDSLVYTKDLVNAPPNLVTPAFLAKEAQSLAKKIPALKVNILNEQECAKAGLEAFLAVARASVNEPYLIEINYSPAKAKVSPVGLIGKGLTYDTGGLCLKPNKYMYGMQSDMAGAATVLGIIKAAAMLKLNVPLTVLILACENGFAGNAYRPGDVLRSLSGKTIEVVDTDAEGRLTLADALTYLSRKPEIESIIDFATLTGSCAAALGDVASGAFGNDEELLLQYKKAADAVGEPIWPLPMFEEYKDDLKSDIADTLQCAGRPDASLAALFLQDFIVGKQRWLHLDVAGTAYFDESNEYLRAGATGRGLWSTIEFLKALS